MKHTNVMVAVLMDRSISHTEIVHTPYSRALAADLAEACEDSVDTGAVVEYWGTWEDEDDVGHPWRIHLTRAADEIPWGFRRELDLDDV